VVVAIGALSACDPAAPYAGSVAADQEVAGAVNARRSAEGRGSLSIDGGLDAAAQRWAEEMARTNTLKHSSTVGAGRSFTAAGENVGVGGSIQAVDDAFEKSPGHLANIVDKRYTVIGVGVATDSHGRVWVVEQFMRPS
jgi:uncharacterized protein YkwD